MVFASTSAAFLALTACSGFDRTINSDDVANMAAHPALRPGVVDRLTYRAEDGYYFQTADHSITCGFLDQPLGQPRRPVGCQGVTWPAPPEMQACWSIDPSAAAVAVGDSAGYLCVNRGYFAGSPMESGADTSGGPVLPVGSSLSMQGFTCLAQPDGVTCRNDVNGRGFEMTPERNRVF